MHENERDYVSCRGVATATRTVVDNTRNGATANSHSDTAVAITSLVATPTDHHYQTNEFEVLRTASPRKLNLITAGQNGMGVQSVTVKRVWKLSC